MATSRWCYFQKLVKEEMEAAKEEPDVGFWCCLFCFGLFWFLGGGSGGGARYLPLSLSHPLLPPYLR